MALILHLNQAKLGRQYLRLGAKRDLTDNPSHCHRDMTLWVLGFGQRPVLAGTEADTQY